MPESEKKPVPRRLNLEIPADLPATYANFAIITHSPWEIFVDFAQILPNTPKARVKARVVMTPTNAKMLLKALEENITRYETQHGEIAMPPRPQSLADELFGSVRSGGDNDNDNEHDPDHENDHDADNDEFDNDTDTPDKDA